MPDENIVYAKDFVPPLVGEGSMLSATSGEHDCWQADWLPPALPFAREFELEIAEFVRKSSTDDVLATPPILPNVFADSTSEKVY